MARTKKTRTSKKTEKEESMEDLILYLKEIHKKHQQLITDMQTKYIPACEKWIQQVYKDTMEKTEVEEEEEEEEAAITQWMKTMTKSADTLDASRSYHYCEWMDKRMAAELELKKLYHRLDMLKHLPLPELPPLTPETSLEDLKAMTETLQEIDLSLDGATPRSDEYEEFMPQDEE
jgi:hypothetical protein